MKLKLILSLSQWLTPAILATRGRDQKDHSLKPTWANTSQNPILKKKAITKQSWWGG
jgi:hypothetical protein